ncbi:MAG: hypothetical protein NC242_04805 [Roseburia sp.]|nr:hypothetical protein [Roseburia sp.]
MEKYIKEAYAGEREAWIMEGQAEERREIITRMLHSGKTPEEIAELLNIPLVEIKAVAERV